MSKYLQITLLSVFLFLVTAGRVIAADKSILIINQVRGGDCCDPGLSTNVTEQLATIKAFGLRSAFVLRYDALTTEYQEIFKDISADKIELGLFLEITPELAREAGVGYKGPVSRWYKAENSYLLGYSPGERRRIINQAMSKFKRTFGLFPKVTSGWMIDSDSLAYLSETYGVVLHQITRDQWGTDSYTLYGGPVGPSYLPSRNWPLLPAVAPKLPIVMVRQTIPDPLRNYGDSFSVYTSQPNDYMKGGKTTGYFENLLGQALSQQPHGLAVVGLESSMPTIYQEEYKRQLAVIANMEFRGASTRLPSAWAKERSKLGNYVSTYAGEDESHRSVWVNAPGYRLRFLINHKTGSVVLDDLRIYGDHLMDPYTKERPLTPNAYWVAPFAIDASRFSSRPNDGLVQKILTWVKRKLNVFDPCMSSAVVINDVCVEPEGMEFPSIVSKDSLQVGDNFLKYRSVGGEEIALNFETESMTVKYGGADGPSFVPNHPITKAINSTKLFGTELERKDGELTLKFKLSEDQTMKKIQGDYPFAFIPESAGGKATLNTSTVLVSRLTVELGRNPIRVVAYLRDENGNIPSEFPIPSLSLEEISGLTGKVEQPETSLAEFYIDIFPSEPGIYTPVVKLGEEEKKLGKIRVVPNCGKEWLCVSRPQYLIPWLKMLVRDRLAH